MKVYTIMIWDEDGQDVYVATTWDSVKEIALKHVGEVSSNWYEWQDKEMSLEELLEVTHEEDVNCEPTLLYYDYVVLR